MLFNVVAYVKMLNQSKMETNNVASMVQQLLSLNDKCLYLIVLHN